MQKNYVNATLMLRLSLDRCQEIQSYGSHSNHNLATPSPTSTTTLLKHIGLKLYNRVRGSCEGQKLCTESLGDAADGVQATPVSRGESTASGSPGTEQLLSTPHSGHTVVIPLGSWGKLGTHFPHISSASTGTPDPAQTSCTVWLQK